MNVYRSIPPLPAIYRPFFLLPSAHAPPQLDYEDSSGIEGYDSDNASGHAEAGEAAGEDGSGGQSPSPSESARADHSKGTRSAARKCRASSQPGDNRLKLHSTIFSISSSCFFSSCFTFSCLADIVPRTTASGENAGVGSNSAEDDCTDG